MTAVISRATRSVNQGLSSASHEVSDKWSIWISVRKILAFKLVITWAVGVQKGRERSFRARKKRFRAQIIFLFLFERWLVHSGSRFAGIRTLTSAIRVLRSYIVPIKLAYQLGHYIHVHGKQLASDSSWEFLKIENQQTKTAQNNSYGLKIAWNY